MAEEEVDHSDDEAEDQDEDGFGDEGFEDYGDTTGMPDWEEEIAAAAKHGRSIPGMPRGLRIRSATKTKQPGSQELDEESSAIPVLKARNMPGQRWAHWELYVLAVLAFLGAGVTMHFVFRQLFPWVPPPPSAQVRDDSWRRGCKQCGSAWWNEFWKWRLEGEALVKQGGKVQEPPPGMDWEWQASGNDTDWYGASAELIDSVVRTFADPGLGPVLQIGCGDSPIPELLHRAGFPKSEHIDIAPEVIDAMKLRYPVAEWPGLAFQVRDFMSRGAPPPRRRFSAVLDKAGIWDWLQDESPGGLPILLSAVRNALVPAPLQGVYVIATKQTPAELSDTLRKIDQGPNAFHVEATRPLGSSGIAW
eukprot:CAMPEP_0115070034 /NCGR_PEP_ID=MMETSP0227-20121206/12887_1 /TAXON_ID=89957 /ORGANISM="Polarella glacialis, Strain CCMP 1383" /LENGTH=361 /DNA_ID=CAMNT_0002456499 /DNA_START=66 /DNA_END=1148 /DNA_ORIENTATION=-